MNHLTTRSRTTATLLTRAGDSSARLTICALGLAFSLSIAALARAQSTAASREAPTALSRKPVMTTHQHRHTTRSTLRHPFARVKQR